MTRCRQTLLTLFILGSTASALKVLHLQQDPEGAAVEEASIEEVPSGAAVEEASLDEVPSAENVDILQEVERPGVHPHHEKLNDAPPRGKPSKVLHSPAHQSPPLARKADEHDSPAHQSPPLARKAGEHDSPAHQSQPLARKAGEHDSPAHEPPPLARKGGEHNSPAHEPPPLAKKAGEHNSPAHEPPPLAKKAGEHNSKPAAQKPAAQEEEEDTSGYHHMYPDDWISGTARLYNSILDPVCVRDVASPHGNCKLLSQSLCGGVGAMRPSELTGHHKQCRKRKESCAVVGSSEHLLSVRWGARIDKHETVIRINAAPAGSTEKHSNRAAYAAHVGTRTDVRFINEYGRMPNPREDGPLCIFLHEPAVMDCGAKCWRNPGLCNISCAKEGPGLCRGRCDMSSVECKAAAQESVPEWDKHDAVFLDNLHGGISDQVIFRATAGFKAVLYALHHCDRVSVFGFGPSCDGAVGERYYVNNTERVMAIHHYDEELRIMHIASESHNKEESVRALLPAEARAWVQAKRLDLMLPPCVGDHPEEKKLRSRFMYMLRNLDIDVSESARVSFSSLDDLDSPGFLAEQSEPRTFSPTMLLSSDIEP